MFLSNGQEVEVVAKCDDGFVVRYVYGEDDEIFRDRDVFIATEVFETPPVHKQNTTLAEINEKITAKRKELFDLQQDIRNAETENAERLKKLKQWRGLERLEDFIDGKITHYVKFPEYSGAPQIIEFKNAVSEYDDGNRPRPLKLLSLFGKSNGDLEWCLNRYNDGSGSHSTVIPVMSYEEAVQIIKEWVIEKALSSPDKPNSYVVEAAEIYGVDIPGYIKAWKQSILENRIDSRAKKAAELESIDAEIAGLQAALN